MPDTPSLKDRPLYEKLRRAGYSKERAAQISNAVARRRRLRGKIKRARARTS